MTIATLGFKKNYISNGYETTFPVTFDYVGDGIDVYLDDVLQTQGYLLTAGGVKFTTIPVAGVNVMIIRNTLKKQLLDFEDGNKLRANTLEYGFDVTIMMIQELTGRIGSSIGINPLKYEDASMTINENADERKGKVVGFDDDGIVELKDKSDFKGDKGDRGFTGDVGPVGPRGVKGDLGIRGDSGIRGDGGTRGLTGDTGVKGDKGDLGDKGEQGNRGFKGDIGNTGIRGLTGAKGEQGNRGETGDIGPSGGEQGSQGERGEKGDTGLKGDTGDVGNTGDTGDRGVKGDAGDTGLTGDTGAMGVRGFRGLIGDTGVRGDIGERGDAGERGLEGDKGEKGDEGDVVGVVGGTGEDGVKGDKGDKGDDGQRGLTGLTGLTGDLGDRGLRGFTGSAGADGADGVIFGTTWTNLFIPGVYPQDRGRNMVITNETGNYLSVKIWFAIQSNSDIVEFIIDGVTVFKYNTYSDENIPTIIQAIIRPEGKYEFSTPNLNHVWIEKWWELL